MWWRICAIARNWRIAVELSIASAAKFERWRRRRGQQFAQPHHRAAAAEIELALGVDHPADRIVKLAGIDPEMDPARAETVGAHRGGEGLERDGAIGRRRFRFGFELLDQRSERKQLGRVVGGQAIGDGGEGFGIGEVAGEVRWRGPPNRPLPRAGSPSSECAGVDRFKRGSVSCEPAGLLGQAELDRGVPVDVGPPVHVVADPAGEAERQRGEAVPLVGPALRRLAEQSGDEPVARIGGMGDRRERALVLEGRA